MTHREFIAAQFFSADLPPKPSPRRPRRKPDPVFLALRKLVKILEMKSPAEKAAYIRWMADRFGVDA